MKTLEKFHSFSGEKQEQSLAIEMSEEARTLKKILSRKGLRYHLIKSLILAQDERWRRA